MTAPEQRWLELVSTPEQICHHPLNASTAKQLFSFAREKRFSDTLNRPECLAGFYDVDRPLTRGSRACSMGKGNKIDFMRESAKNATADYCNVLNFTVQRNNAPKHSFGSSRGATARSGAPPTQRDGSPGPGAYDPKLPPSQAKCTFKIKLKEPAVFRNAVGPGAYDLLKLYDINRPMPLSRFRSRPNCKMMPELHPPGKVESWSPLFYNTGHQMNGGGTFFNSKYRNSRCRSFSRALRSGPFVRSDLPGPGEYRLPSEFGLYASSAFAKENHAQSANPKRSD